MDFSGRLILAFLEEDNTQRSLFHVRPLLTQAGPVPLSDIETYADTGFIRIVPDKNEQYTFKERMRTLGNMCVINLRDFPQDANKIRPNRNYAPTRGEPHQFIVYSNAVQALPPDMVFEVIAGKQNTAAPYCATPWCYLREGGRIEGPFDAKDGSVCGPLAALRPDSARLFSITLPTGQEKLFYWPVPIIQPSDAPSNADSVAQMEAENPLHGEAEEPSPEKAEQPIHEGAEQPAHEEAENPETAAGAKQGIGTPIYVVSTKKTLPGVTRNHLNATVDRMARDHQMEALGARMEDASQMSKVDSPLDIFRRALDTIWFGEDTQRQAVGYLLSKPCAAQLITRIMTASEDDAVASAMNRQLLDMEAERLALLMQLDKAKADKDSLFSQALAQAETKATEKLAQLEKQSAKSAEAAAVSQGQLHALLEERDALIRELKQLGGPQRLLAPKEGAKESLRITSQRVRKHLGNAGFSVDADESLHLLTLLALCPQVQLKAQTFADGVLAAQNLAAAVGGETVKALTGEAITYLPGGGGVAVAIVSEGQTADCAYTRLIPAREACPKGSAYTLDPWPCAALQTGDSVPMPPLPKEEAISMPHLKVTLDEGSMDNLPEEIMHLLQKAAAALKGQGAPLPLALFEALHHYLLLAGGNMQGGIAAALDLGLCAFVIPHILYYSANADFLAPYLHSLPRTSRVLCGS